MIQLRCGSITSRLWRHYCEFAEKCFCSYTYKLYSQCSPWCQVEFVLIYCHVVQFTVICVVLLWFRLWDSGKAFCSAEEHAHPGITTDTNTDTVSFCRLSRWWGMSGACHRPGHLCAALSFVSSERSNSQACCTSTVAYPDAPALLGPIRQQLEVPGSVSKGIKWVHSTRLI